MEEAGVQARDEEATATQGSPHEKRLPDEGGLQAIEETVAALALSPGESAGVMLCLLSNKSGGIELHN